MAAALIAEVGAGHAFELTIEERDDLRAGFGVARAPVAEELRDFASVGAVFREHDFRIAGGWGEILSNCCKLRSIHGEQHEGGVSGKDRRNSDPKLPRASRCHSRQGPKHPKARAADPNDSCHWQEQCRQEHTF